MSDRVRIEVQLVKNLKNEILNFMISGVGHIYYYVHIIPT